MKTYSLRTTLILLVNLSNPLWATTTPLGYTEIACTITPKASKDEHISHPHVPGPELRTQSTAKSVVSSNNWSGYAAATNFSNPAKNVVSAVSASWIIPTVKSSGVNAYSSYWVGIDGYSSPIVEQIGTEHDFINGKAQYSAWFEMYPGGSYNINGLPVNPGDVITASVVYSGNNHLGFNIFTLQILNNTHKVSVTIPLSYTTFTSGPNAQRSSAEWIIEAPYLNSILPLSDFVTAYMFGCNATINNIAAPLNSTSWQNNELVMVTNSGAAKATPSSILLGNDAFFVTWNSSAAN